MYWYTFYLANIQGLARWFYIYTIRRRKTFLSVTEQCKIHSVIANLLSVAPENTAGFARLSTKVLMGNIMTALWYVYTLGKQLAFRLTLYNLDSHRRSFLRYSDIFSCKTGWHRWSVSNTGSMKNLVRRRRIGIIWKDETESQSTKLFPYTRSRSLATM